MGRRAGVQSIGVWLFSCWQPVFGRFLRVFASSVASVRFCLALSVFRWALCVLVFVLSDSYVLRIGVGWKHVFVKPRRSLSRLIAGSSYGEGRFPVGFRLLRREVGLIEEWDIRSRFPDFRFCARGERVRSLRSLAE